MALGGIKTLFAEIATTVRFGDQPPSITFYAEDSFSFLTMEGYVETLLSNGRQPVAYVTSDVHDPLLERSRASSLAVFPFRWLGPTSISKSKSPVLAMTMPDLGSLHVARPSSGTRCVYIFHSLISAHRGYRGDAFDHYDDFFCAGEHHVTEIARRFELLGRPCPRLHRVGYYKLDRMYREHQLLPAREGAGLQPSILIAPSWHPENLLEKGGVPLVAGLLQRDLQVIVRPHPAFFTSIYPQGRAILEELETRFGSHPHFVLDRATNSERSFHEADLLVTDWSGSAYEYAFATERPVLFIDTPPKTRNDGWQDFGIVPFEVTLREQVGRVLGPDRIERAPEVALELLGAADDYRESLIRLRDNSIFNFGRSGTVGAELLERFFQEAAT